MKKIVLFSDGTGNSASSPAKTNVWRAYQALDVSPGSDQVAFYDNGVGTSRFTPMAILGLAFGLGLARNVKQIYGFVCRSYEPGDEIYGFGFSRGAFTMRVAAAFIANEGIINKSRVKDERDMERFINAAYRKYRREHFTPSFLSRFLGPLRDGGIWLYESLRGLERYDPGKNIGYQQTPTEDRLIEFIGVWDTVDAYGFPIDEMTRAWDMVVWPLSAKDRDLSPRIGRACHALALDERRVAFEPMLWNESKLTKQSNIQGECISQVWFSGVHANVGGGYPDDSLAHVSLDWMLEQSESIHRGNNLPPTGLTFNVDMRKAIRDAARADGPLYNNRSGAGNLYRYGPRNIEQLCSAQNPGLANWLKSKLGRLVPRFVEPLLNRTVALNKIHLNKVKIDRVKVHHTVFSRIRQTGTAYAPINLPARYAVVDSNGDINDVRQSSTTPMPETPQQADERRANQRLVWNKVLGRKLLYATSIAALIGFIFYPYIAESNGLGQESLLSRYLMPLLGTFSAFVNEIPLLVGKIPGLGFAESWAQKYQPFPFVFILSILFIAGLLMWSRHLRSLIRSQMLQNWRHVTKSNQPAPKRPNALSVALAKLLDSSGYSTLSRVPRMTIEAFFVLVFLFLVAALGSRTFYTLYDAAGGVCEAGAETNKFGEVIAFNPKNACFNTGLMLQAGKHYEITFTVNNWMDKTIPADVKGWCEDWCGENKEPPWYLSLFVPVRRHLLTDWYQPVARIDNQLLERYPLEPEKPEQGKEQKVMMTEITARRTGLLYLYVNDAVLLAPAVWKEFYSNNEGRADVIVTELKQAE